MDIVFRNQRIASIRFKADDQIRALRGFDFVTLHLPFQVNVEIELGGCTWLGDSITAELSGVGPGGAELLLATGYVPMVLESRTSRFDLDVIAVFRCSPKAVAEYERFRSGKSIDMRIRLTLQVHELEPGSDYRRALCQTHYVCAQEDFRVDNMKWIGALKAIGLSASILVEIPFPLESDPQDDALVALAEAVACFENGGSVAWKASVGSIRPYLEKWRKAEPFPQTEPKDGSAADRRWKLLNCREALYKCCHFWVHESAAATSREDALFALSTFAALLRASRS
jgi:hypothetical protein